MNILLIGGGNSSHIFSVLAKIKGHDVTILTSKPNLWNDTVIIENNDLNLINQRIISASGIKTINNYNTLNNYDMIILAGVPVEFYEEILLKIEPNINSEIYIGSVCAYGGFELIVRRIFKKKN